MAIHQQGNALVCVGEFLNSGAAATGLTVAVDIYEIGQASGGATQIVSSGVATEIARGAYFYRLPAVNVDLNALYVFIFFTGGTADQKVVVQGWSVGMTWVENLNASVSGIAAAVWAVGARTLTGFGTLVDDTAAAVWASGARTLTSFGTLVADVVAAVWASGTRTLTSYGALAADVAAEVWGASTRTLTGLGAAAGDVAAVVWTAPARTLTSFGSLVADVAAEVWNSLAATFNTPDTMGEQLNAAGAPDEPAEDPWAVTVPGSYPDGTAGHTLGNLQADILGNLQVTEITLTSPLLEGGVLELVAGDAYDLDHGRALDDWALTGQPSLVGAAVFFVIDGVLSVEAVTVGGAGTGTQQPVFELSAADTAALTRVGERTYRYQIQAVWLSDDPEQPAVLTRGDVTVIDRAAS